MIFRAFYPWCIEPPTHVILTTLPLVYRIPYPWYIEPPIHGISNPLPMVYRRPPHLLIRNEGAQNTTGGSIYHTGDSVLNQGVQHTMDKN